MPGDECGASENVLGLLQLQRELLRRAASGAGLDAVLELLVELIETCIPGALASVHVADPEGGTLATVAAPGLQGSRARWSTPIVDERKNVLGAFALHYEPARSATPEERELMEVAAGIAAIVFERTRALESSAHELGEREAVDRRYRTLIEQLPLVIYVDRLDETSSNVFTSRQIEGLLGYSVEEWRADGDLFVKLLHPEDRDRVLAEHARTHRTHEPISVEYRLRSRGGDYVWIRDEGVVVTDEDGRPLHLQGYLLDVSAERNAEEQLRRQALYDSLTGLANRASFNDRLEQMLALQKRGAGETALLFIDLNNFKSINDRYGHDVGDEVLRALARHLAATIRTGDTAARLGGDEFAAILHDVSDPSVASGVAERIGQSLADPIDVGHLTVRVEASIGIAIGDDPQLLLKQADAAMYRAKGNRELRFAFFDPELDEAALTRFRRVAELTEAVELQQFVLHYQPVVALSTGAVEGYEALLRWLHPLESELPPLDFIPIAEESGLIVPIGEWVLHEACLHAAELSRRDGHAYEIAVNVSGRQLQHPLFTNHVEAALERSGLPPEQLVLEITESVLIDTGGVDARLHRLKENGVKIALDDFGTGYGSLAYLQRLPVDIVKIDRSFTASVDLDASHKALLRAIIGLGDALGTRLVAEGIERLSQSETVRSLGCGSGQGFYFGRPAAPLVDQTSRRTLAEWSRT
jgi:diguanylate cyclase (GGDEF)-like protein/PAS domain S-box-containing protein